MNDRMDPSYTNRTFLPDPPVEAPPVIVARRSASTQVARPAGSICNPALVLIVATIVALLAMAL